MTKLSIDYKAINNKVLPNIDKSIEKISSALNNIGTINVPSDFTYAKYIGNTPSELESIRNKLKNKRSTINNTSINYSKKENSNREKIFDIKIDKLRYRKSNKT